MINNKEEKKILKEKELFSKYRDNNDKDALNELFESNVALAISLGNDYRFLYNGNYKEAIITAQEGLFKAINSFDCTRGCKFSTYAYKIIRGYLFKNREEITYNGSVNLLEELIKVRSSVEHKYNERLISLGENYNEMVDEIVDEMYKKGRCSDENEKGKQIHKKEIRNMINLHNYISINEVENVPTQEDDIYNPVAKYEYTELKKILEESMNSTLTEREIDVLKLRYGLDGSSEETYDNIIEIFTDKYNHSYSKEGIRKTEKSALKKLGRKTKIIKCKDYIND